MVENTESRDEPLDGAASSITENASPGREGASPVREGASPVREGASPVREGDRIAKLLARAGVASRREVERMIDEGRVRIGDQVVTTPATVLTSLAGVTVDGKMIVAAPAARLYIFHKPSGLLTAERDFSGRPTIYNALRNALPEGAPRVMPVGRLDLNTEGLLLLTNDGELKRALELPSNGVPRTYRARTFGDITQPQLEALSEGIEIEGVRYGSINANMERRTGRNQWVEMTLTEGKNREVRRVLEYLGLQVSRLLRVSYGPFRLLDLPRGMAIEIAPVEVEKFRRTLGLAAQDAGTVRRAEKPRPASATTPAPAPARARAEPEGNRRARPAARAPERGDRPYGEASRPDARRPGFTGRARTPGRIRPARRARTAGRVRPTRWRGPFGSS